MLRSSRLLVSIGGVALFLVVLATMSTRAQRRMEPQDRTQEPKARKAHSDPEPAPGEPPADVVRKLEFQRYEEIEKAGGLPVTITATGRNLVLHPKLHEVRKDSCVPVVYRPGAYECHLTIKVSLEPDGSDPKEQGERIGVRWQDGEWVQD